MKKFDQRYDVAVLGGGIAGMATAARLQARGYSTLVIEAHGQVGGCAGFFRKRGFSFDVGATTLVDFEPGGVGGELMDELGLELDAELLPGYSAWLPDSRVELYREHARWAKERTHQLGDSHNHRRFWQLMDTLARVFWQASRDGIRLPIRTPGQLFDAVRLLPFSAWPLARYLRSSLGDVLRDFGLRDDKRLVGLLSMLVEDTVHGSVDGAPVINAALGVTIRGAGLSRARGGMRGFWEAFVDRYRALGGAIRIGTRALAVEGKLGAFRVSTSRGTVEAGQVVSALPIDLTAGLAVPEVSEALAPFIRRDRDARGSALVVFLGVPENEVAGESFTHHQLLQSFDAPLGNGNNMFVSVSSPGDLLSAPDGHRAVMISTHCETSAWKELDEVGYGRAKDLAQTQLIQLARRVYPHLGERAVVAEMGTPCTYQRYTGRIDGAVGGVRQTTHNSNQHAVPHDLGVPGFWLTGDDSWPGLGTVASCLSSRIVAALAERAAVPTKLTSQTVSDRRELGHAVQ